MRRFLFLIFWFALAGVPPIQVLASESFGFIPGLGIQLSNPLKITGSNTGAPSIFGHLDFVASLKLRFGSYESLAFLPQLKISSWFLTGKTADDGSSVTRSHLGLGFGTMLGSETLLQFGPGLYWEKVSGDGSALTLPNGTSTATFYAPGDSSTSRLLYLEVGILFQYATHQYLVVDLHLLNPLSSKRTLQLAILLERDF